MEGLSANDIAAINNSNGMNGNFWWIWIFVLMFGMGGNGWGNSAAMQGAFTRSDMTDGFNWSDIKRGINNLGNGLADLGYASLNQTNGINQNIMQQTGALSQGLANIGFEAQQCCCTTNRNIDSLRYDAQKNTADIVNAIHSDGEATRALMVQNTIQELRDQLQEAKLANSQCAQNAYLVNSLRPTPVPAYITASPYASNNGCYCGV